MLQSIISFKSLIFLVVLFFSSCGSDDTQSSLFVEDFLVTIDENPRNGQELGSIEASSDQGDVTFSLSSQNIPNALLLDETSGLLTVGDSSVFDFEINPVITGVVFVNDLGESKEVSITINLIDVTGVINASAFTQTIDENPTDGEVLGTIVASSDIGDVSFSIGQMTPEDAVAIGESSGEVTVNDRSKFDFESNANTEVSGVILVSNGEIEEEVLLVISLLNVDDTEGFTIWSGASITFTKEDGADPDLEENQDRITESVWITRGNTGGEIYNANAETVFEKGVSPLGTEWAIGETSNTASLVFESFRNAVEDPKFVEGIPLVLHIISEDIYIDVEFVSWSEGQQGGFSYIRSTE